MRHAAAWYNDIAVAFNANVNIGEIPYTPPKFAGGQQPTVTAAEIDDLIVFLCTADGWLRPRQPLCLHGARAVPAGRTVRVRICKPMEIPAMNRYRKSLLAGLLVAGAVSLSSPALATPEQDARLDAMQRQLQRMQAMLQQLADENRALREHEKTVDQGLAQLKAPATAGGAMVAQTPANSALPGTAGAAGTVVTATPPPGPDVTPLGNTLATSAQNLRLWGYGEIYYISPTEVRRDTTMDLARAVFGIGYRLDERTEFNSEYEVEHAIASADDAGEFEVEQFWVDRR